MLFFSYSKHVMLLSVIMIIALPLTRAQNKPSATLDNWSYIQIDSTREMWGKWNHPRFLRYFGLDMHDVTGDGYMDIVSGRYFYRNSGGDMTAPWERIDLKRNLDGLLFLDIKGEKFGHIIAAALPDVYLLIASDRHGNNWDEYLIGQIPPCTHNNGQGYRRAQIIPEGNEEILLASGGGIYYFEVPLKKSQRLKGNWKKVLAAPEASDEGFGIGDIDGDGLLDIVAAVRKSDQEGESMEVRWWKNPGNGEGNWKSFPIGITIHDSDRIEVADINGNGKMDVIVSEERYPGKEPDANLFWFEQPNNPEQNHWKRHTIITTYSLNNLDVGDINRNGFMDIVTSEHKGDALRTLIFENDGKGSFKQHLIDRGKESHLGTRLADLDGNGLLDIVSIGWDQYQYLHLWKNNGDKWRIRKPFVPWTL